jgi:hypothetical protein
MANSSEIPNVIATRNTAWNFVQECPQQSRFDQVMRNMTKNSTVPHQTPRLDLREVRELAAAMSDEDGVFSTSIRTLTQCRSLLQALADEVEQLRQDQERLNFAVASAAFWAPVNSPRGEGKLRYTEDGRRTELYGPDVRTALDTARREVAERRKARDSRQQ